jgi:hypothetical protein
VADITDTSSTATEEPIRESAPSRPGRLRRTDLLKSFWRYIWSFQIS